MISKIKHYRNDISSYLSFSKEALAEKNWKRDAILTTTSQLALVNWLQLIPPFLAGAKNETIETNWYVMFAGTALLGYPYALFRDWLQNKKLNLDKVKRPIVKFLSDTIPLAMYHGLEGFVRYSALGEKGMKLGAITGIYTLAGFLMGWVYGKGIDQYRHMGGIKKLENPPIPIKTLELESQSKKDSWLMAATVAMIMGSYGIMQTAQSTEPKNNPEHTIKKSDPQVNFNTIQNTYDLSLEKIM